MQWALLLAVVVVALIVIGIVIHLLKWLLILALGVAVIGLLTGRVGSSSDRR